MGSICSECDTNDSNFAHAQQELSTSNFIKELNLDTFIQMPKEEYRIVGNWPQNIDKNDINGFGILYQPRTFYYEGDIRKGEAHGKGIIKWEGIVSDSYEGQFKENKPQGKGTYKNPQLTLEGEWQNGQPKKGYLKIGESLHTLKHIELKKSENYNVGSVEISLADGTYYKGQIQLHRGSFYFDGTGSITFKDGTKYEGEWFEGKMHGKGMYEWTKQRTKYIGDYKFGYKDGEGKYYLNNGKYMKGKWENGKKQGRFQLFEEKDGQDYLISSYKFMNDRLQGNNDEYRSEISN